MNDEQIQRAFHYLTTDDHEKIIYGVLKKLGVNRHEEYFDDLVTEGKIAFVNGYCQAEATLLDDPYQLNGRLFKHVEHRTIDYLRRQTRQQSHNEFSLDNEAVTEDIRAAKLGQSFITQDSTDQLIQMEEFHELYEQSPEGERRYLMEHLINHLSLREIALKYDISPAAVSKAKRSSISRARRLFRP